MNAVIKGSGQPVRLYIIENMFLVASHRGVDVSWQCCAWADSSFCTSWADDTYRKAVYGSTLGAPDEQCMRLFADNLPKPDHGQAQKCVNAAVQHVALASGRRMHRRDAAYRWMRRASFRGARAKGPRQVAAGR